MNRWTRYSWYRPLTVVVLSAFFAVYGIDLAMMGQLKAARAESVDDLLNADDSGLLGGTPQAAPAKKAKSLDDEDAPAAKPAAKPSKAGAFDDEDDTPVAKPAAKPSKAGAFDDEDDTPVAKPAAKPSKAGAFDDEEDKPVAKPAAKPSSADLDEDEELTPPKKARSSSAPSVIGLRKDGPTKIVGIVFPATAKNKKRSVEVQLLVRDYLRGKGLYTNVPVNTQLGDNGPAGEQPMLKKVDGFLTEATRSFDKGSYETAIENLDSAQTALAPWLDLRDGQTRFERVLALTAASYILNGEKKDGREVFQRLLQINPKADFKGYDFNDEVTDEIAKAKSGLADAPKGAIAVNSDPSGASVFIDGQFRGPTPIQIDGLVVGEHSVKVSEPGLKDVVNKITVYEGMTKTLSAKPEQTSRLIDYKAALNGISTRFEHKAMWRSVQEMNGVLKNDRLLLLRVEETNGRLGLSAYYYDMAKKQFKTASTRFDLADEEFNAATVSFLDSLFDDDLTSWQSTFFKEAKSAPVAAGGKTPVYKQWWLWTIVGVVVAGAAVGALVPTLKKDSKKNSNGLGNGISVRF